MNYTTQDYAQTLPIQDYSQNRPVPPPTWLNPQKLGVTELRGIPRERVRVIDNGRNGLIRFFSHARPKDVVAWDAFVINSSDNQGSYVYSKEQFWLAAAAAFKSQQFKLQLNRNLYRWLRQLSHSSYLGDLLADVSPRPRRRLFNLKRASFQSKKALGDYFDIHEYATCAHLPQDNFDRPALLRGIEGDVEVAYVPDTSHLSSDIARSLKMRASGPKAEPPDDTVTTPGTTSSQLAVVRRTPHMDFDDGPFQPGATFPLTIFADNSSPRSGEDTKQLEFEAPPDVTEFVLNVWLLASPHFVINDSGPKAVTITRAVERSTEAVFQVGVRNDLTDRASARLTAIFQYNQRPCGSVSREVDLGKPPESIPVGADAGDPQLEIEPPAQPADLQVLVANPTADRLEYDCIVTTPHLPKFKNGCKDKWRPGGTTEEVVADYFSEFTAPDIGDALRVANLRGAGIELFEAAPDHFKEAFWGLLDGGHPLRSISIVSIEPFTPWELMVPNRPKLDGTTEKLSALGMQFAVGRWISDTYRSSRQRISLTDSLVFAPRYSEKTGPKPLVHSDEECKMVRKEFPGDEIDPADFDGFEKAMGEGARSLLHFICHGKSGTGAQAIYAQDGSVMRSYSFTGADNTPGAIAKRKPFVFLNACEVGRTTPHLVGVGGFAPTFIKLGACGVIAPLWSVKDEFAQRVAEDFYGKVKSKPGEPFAKILADIRARAYARPDPQDSYAAYCFYGDPLATQCK